MQGSSIEVASLFDRIGAAGGRSTRYWQMLIPTSQQTGEESTTLPVRGLSLFQGARPNIPLRRGNGPLDMLATSGPRRLAAHVALRYAM